MLAFLILSATSLATDVRYGAPYELYHGEGEGPPHAPASRATASTTLSEGQLRHDPSRAMDGDMATAWCEGIEGPGIGATLTLHWDAPVELAAVQIWGGYFLDEGRLLNNARLQRYRISFDGQPHTELFTQDVVEGEFDASRQFGNVLFFERFDHPAMGNPAPTVRSLTIEVLEAYPGRKYADLCISEVVVHQHPSP